MTETNRSHRRLHRHHCAGHHYSASSPEHPQAPTQDRWGQHLAHLEKLPFKGQCLPLDIIAHRHKLDRRQSQHGLQALPASAREAAVDAARDGVPHLCAGTGIAVQFRTDARRWLAVLRSTLHDALKKRVTEMIEIACDPTPRDLLGTAPRALRVC